MADETITNSTTTETSAGSEGTSESTGAETSEGSSSGASDASSERQALIDAAREAVAEPTEAKKPEANSTPKIAGLDDEPPAKGGDEAPEVLSIEDILKGREAKQAVRNKLDEERAATARERQEAAEERAAAKREREEGQRELARIKRLAENPTEALKELGWDGQKLVDTVLTDATPEGREMARQRAENASLKEKVERFEKFLEQQETAQKEQQQAAQERARTEEAAASQKRFLSLVPEDSALRTLYSEDDIATLANGLGWKIKNANGGRLVASFEQIRDHLEKQAKERLAKLRGGGTEQKSEPTKAAPQKSGTGSRTLSTSGASERRASPRPIRDMSPAEEREALIAAAKEAVQTDK